MSLHDSIVTAWRARAALHEAPDLDAYRIFHGWHEGCPGLAIDRLGEVATIEYRPGLADRLDEAVAGLDACRRFACIVARPRGEAGFALRGSVPDAPVVVHEHGLRLLVDPARPGNPGLYLDARPARQWLRANSQGRRVVNLFAFTGSLGVAAAVGGARSLVHVDSTASALATCRENHALNQVPCDDRSLARVNVYQHLRRQSAGRQRCGGIILDPPPLEGLALRTDRTPGGRGVVALVPLVTRMLEPGGWLLCLFHQQPRAHDELDQAVQRASRVPLIAAWRGQSGPDFPESDPHRKLRMTAFVHPQTGDA
ncbi:MAG TPA: class I SAM-dependent methyltransferase [Haliangium sp.]|nr:class I SAM-dependent methyltransferase [Haliangium sp.]